MATKKRIQSEEIFIAETKEQTSNFEERILELEKKVDDLIYKLSKKMTF